MFNNYCVIFDMDGVLADTGSLHFESWVKMAKGISLEFTRELFNETFGQQSPAIIRKLVGSEVDNNLVVKWANLKELYYRKMVKDKLTPLPGVIRIIKELKSEGFKLAVGSSGPPENVDLLLTKLKIKKYFNVVITAAEVEKGKPEPDVFLMAANYLNINPKNCIVIEDAPVGIEAAKRAGMLSVALTTTHDKEELLDANLVVSDLSNITISDIKKLLDIEGM
ncbi:MAG: HAD family phosphatase [Promethearchaeota archaeon]|nr:MAG: HAD family phosphatase [Candidatus Lokiarchaeota archaeon]